MIVLNLAAVGTAYDHKWPDTTESFRRWLEYRVSVERGERTYRIGFGEREVYGRVRPHIVVWDGVDALVEFNGTDDFDVTGDIISELKVRIDQSMKMCRYPEHVVPDRYAGLRIEGLPVRIAGARNAWGVLCNIADHNSICALAALRQGERS